MKAFFSIIGFFGFYALAGWIADNTPWQVEVAGFIIMVIAVMVGIKKLIYRYL